MSVLSITPNSSENLNENKQKWGPLGFQMGSLGFEPRISRAPGVNLRPSSTTTPLRFMIS